MKSTLLSAMLILFAMHSNAQVGIATATPDAQLDIRASNQAAPANTDGVLIPKINAFPASNPTVAQQGMLVYLNIPTAGKPVGFYYWDFATLSWIGIASTLTSDKDWLESATGLAPDDINDDIYHMGNTAIGKVTPTVPLDIENTTRSANIVNTGNFSNSLSVARAGISNFLGGATNDVITGVSQTFSGNGNGIRYGTYNTFSGNPFSDSYGTYNSFLLTNGVHYGLYNSFPNNGFSPHYGVYNALGGTGSGYQYGIYSVFSNTGGGEQRGVQNVFNGASSFGSSKYGVHNQMLGANDSSYYGILNTMSSTGMGSKYGLYNDLLNGTGTKYGIYNTLTSSQAQFGMFNTMSINTAGFASQFGIQNTLTSISTSGGHQYGIYNTISGTSTGDVAGVSNVIDNTGNGIHFGISNFLSGAADGSLYGTSNSISASGNGTHIANSNTLSGGGTGIHTTVQNMIQGAGTNVQIGVHNIMLGTGNGDNFGVESIMNGTGNGTHYGYYTQLSGTGSGNKYGSYNVIPSTAGGTHYAVYAYATKTGSYAGYFQGSVAIGNSLGNTYTMPPSRGTNGQTMQTDGAGNVGWVNPNSGMSLSRANLSANQNLTIAGWQKINFDVEQFDINGEYLPGSARFAVAKPGYYRINAAIHTNSMANTQFYSIGVYKNGVLYQETTANHFNNGPVIRNISCVVYLTTFDYVEIYAQNYQSGAQIDAFAAKSFFEVEQIR